MLNDGYIFIRKYVPTPEEIEQDRELLLKRVREQKEQEEKENEERRKQEQERQQNGIFVEYVYITPEDRTYLAGVSHTDVVNDIINNTQFQ